MNEPAPRACMMRCPCSQDGCSSWMLMLPPSTDGRYSKDDAERLKLAWNLTRWMSLENLRKGNT